MEGAGRGRRLGEEDHPVRLAVDEKSDSFEGIDNGLIPTARPNPTDGGSGGREGGGVMMDEAEVRPPSEETSEKVGQPADTKEVSLGEVNDRLVNVSPGMEVSILSVDKERSVLIAFPSFLAFLGPCVMIGMG